MLILLGTKNSKFYVEIAPEVRIQSITYFCLYKTNLL